MKYYTYLNTNSYNKLGVADSRLRGTNSDSFENLKPVVLTPEGIKETIKYLKKDKQDFKIIADFSKVDTKYDTMVLMSNFYELNWLEVYNFVENEYKKQYPVEKEIKTNFAHTSQNCSALVKVFAKQGVKLSKFKTYSVEEVEKLIENNQIVIISATAYSKRMFNTDRPFISSYTLAKKLAFDCIDAYNFDSINREFPYLINELIKDINFVELEKDYEEKYLPAHKQCLRYLVDCAKVSVVHKEEEKKDLYRKIEKINESKKDYQNVEKLAVDATKGR